MTKIIPLQTSEAQLIKGCIKGDRKAQHQLYLQHAPALLAVCRRYTNSLEDAQEVLSNAFVKIFSKINSYAGGGSFEGWLRKIVVNESLNFIRYQKNWFVEVNLNHHQEPATDTTFEDESAAQLLALINTLPLGYKAVFNLYAIEGYSHKEIAALLQISEGASKSQLSMARQQLQHAIAPQKILKKQ